MDTVRAIQVNMTASSDPVKFFKDSKISLNEDVKEGCFARYIGMEGSWEEYLRLIEELDRCFVGGSNGSPYYRTDSLKKPESREAVERLEPFYEEWKHFRGKTEEEAAVLQLPVVCSDKKLNKTLKMAVYKVFTLFEADHKNATETIIKNFMIKLFGWIDYYWPKLYPDNTGGNLVFSKFIFMGTVKPQEYLFLYLLYLTGCDVLSMNPREDVQGFSNPLMSLSRLMLCRNLESQAFEIPPFTEESPKRKTGRRRPELRVGIAGSENPRDSVAENESPRVSTAGSESPRVSTAGSENPRVGAAGSENPVRVEIPVRAGRQNKQAAGMVPAAGKVPAGAKRQEGMDKPAAVQPMPHGPRTATGQEELSYEELALYAGSVVMLKVYDEKRECFKSGSGVVISSKGYILTNYHVIAGGDSFGVQFENDETEHPTDEIIKCHSFNDLAILRVHKAGVPIKLYAGEQVTRGRKVVAIGSPLGLFNSVSNGIVSGFRNIGEVSMIQFTAPTSHGSSGGALLDMQGRMIGIITAGFDDGQNLNLAVDFNTIGAFVRGFV